MSIDVMPVLLAEDEAADAFLMERAFRLAQVTNPLVAVPDGQEAIWYLQGKGPYADRHVNPEPCLVLLDLKMRVVSGFDVLRWIQEQPQLRHVLPVIVLSSSDHGWDMDKAFKLGAHEYLVKPMSFNALVAMAGNVKRDWLEPMRLGHQLLKRKRQEQRN